MSKRIYIKNLPFCLDQEALEQALREVLTEFGNVLSLCLVYEGNSIRPKGLCFAEMQLEAEAESVISAIDGLKVLGHRLNVASAIPKLCAAAPLKEAEAQREPKHNTR